MKRHTAVSLAATFTPLMSPPSSLWAPTTWAPRRSPSA